MASGGLNIWDFPIFYQIFLSSQVTRDVIISSQNGISNNVKS